MRRRAFISLLGSAAICRPMAAHSQWVSKKPRVGIIDDGLIWDHFRRGLHAHGYLEGRNIVLEERKAEATPEALATAAAQLADLPVDVIVVWGTPASRAAKRATTTIPIVAIAVGDPVRAGLAASFARPGGNVTGSKVLGSDVVAKRLQLLKELIPQVRRVAFLWNPDNESNAAQVDELRMVLPRFDISLISVEVRNVSELERPHSYDARAARGVSDDQRPVASHPCGSDYRLHG